MASDAQFVKAGRDRVKKLSVIVICHGISNLACNLQETCFSIVYTYLSQSDAFLQDDKKEQDRDVYLEPTADLRTRLGIDKDFLLRLTGSVYGLRNAPTSLVQASTHRS